MKTIRLRYILFFFFGFILISVFILFTGCNKDEPVPGYIHIDKFTFNINNSSQGSSSQKIVDAWIYIDDQFVGVYEMPFTIPVLYTGKHQVKLFPGVMENGIAETRIPYPFYAQYVQDIMLTPGAVTTIYPTTTYLPNVNFAWMEDFNGVSMGICTNIGTQDSIMQITKDSSEVFEGGSGRTLLGANQSAYIGISCDKFVLPQGGASVFLELNYKCNTDLNVGLIGYNGGNIVYQGISLSLRPTNGWNKVYVNLANEVSGAVTATKFGIFFSMRKDPAIAISDFYLDNIKLIH